MLVNRPNIFAYYKFYHVAKIPSTALMAIFLGLLADDQNLIEMNS